MRQVEAELRQTTSSLVTTAENLAAAKTTHLHAVQVCLPLLRVHTDLHDVLFVTIIWEDADVQRLQSVLSSFVVPTECLSCGCAGP